MAVGARVRAMFGKHEHKVSTLWRSMFLDLEDWTAQIRRWHPGPQRVLEVGCGEGYSTEWLARAFPHAEIVGIDVADNVGRLFRGPRDRVTFRVQFAEELAAAEPGSFDLIVLCDVIHHVPLEARESLLAAIRTLLAPGGRLAMKDWARSPAPIHWLCLASDRWLTGDRVNFLKADEAKEMLQSAFGSSSIRDCGSISPWSNNYAYLVAP